MPDRNGPPAEGGANIVITHVVIHPPQGGPIEIPIERFRGNGPGLVSVEEETGQFVNYYGFPYTLRFRKSDVLAPGASRVHLG